MVAANLLWNMTRKCNFRCKYCYFPHDNTPVEENIPARAIVEFLDSTGREWTVGMTGGEPFIYPGFVDICATLSGRHRIAVDTNLSVTPKVREFAERIDPAKVDDIYAAVHIEERERRDAVDAFIANARLLLDKGFNLIANYVLHPDLLERYAADEKYFGDRGVTLTPRPFKGKHEGRPYPEAYSDESRAILAKSATSGTKVAFNFMGIPCNAGISLLRMEPDGAILRCPGDKTVLGNVLTGVELPTEAEPCRVRRCPCRGVEHLLASPAQTNLVDAVGMLNTGDMDGAEALLAPLTRSACATNNLGVLEWRRGETERATKLFARAAEMNPALSLYEENRDGAADKDFEPIICTSVGPDTL